jgi:hypothetical protein
MACIMNNNLIRLKTGKAPNMLFRLENDEFFKIENLQPFGRIGYVMNWKEFKK